MRRNLLERTPGFRQILHVVGLPLVVTSLLPLNLYLNVSIFPVCLLYVTTLPSQTASILHTAAGRGESFKWQAVRTCALAAVAILFPVVMVTTMQFDKRNENKDSMPPVEENIAAYLIEIGVLLRGFQYIGHIGAMVSALYSMDVRLARTLRPRPGIEGPGGRFCVGRVAARSLDGVHGQSAFVPSAKEMLTSRRKFLPMPVYAVVAGAVVVLCMVVAGWPAKVALDIGLLNLVSVRGSDSCPKLIPQLLPP